MKISPANTASVLLSDEEYLGQKERIKEERDVAQRQLAAEQQQGDTWIDDCERFFAFTQKLCTRFTEASNEEKRGALFFLCKKLTLRDQRVSAELREPFAELAAFPLAGRA